MKKRKTLIIDAIALLGSLSGIGRYNYEIIKRLNQDSFYSLSYFYGYISKKLLLPNSTSQTGKLHAFITQYPRLKSITRRLARLLTRSYISKYNLYWQPNFIPLDSIHAHITVATIHDFSWELYPEFHPKERIDYFKKNFYSSINLSDVS